jgi:hypothetical protein
MSAKRGIENGAKREIENEAGIESEAGAPSYARFWRRMGDIGIGCSG